MVENHKQCKTGWERKVIKGEAINVPRKKFHVLSKQKLNFESKARFLLEREISKILSLA